MNIAEIRQRFIDYYGDMGYRFLPRSPMIDPSIPMSFVMSAGLVQVETSLARARVREGNRFVLTQECFRHFDIEKVGTDNLHLSLFEMPGAFVFGANGKVGTIQKMWDLATVILKIDKKNLWASYFSGGQVLNKFKGEDSITREAWLNVGIPRNHIVGLGTKHNYWIQGKGINGLETIRKCGPNTELFYDLGIEKSCGEKCKPGCTCGRFLEFSNSLFISNGIDKSTHNTFPLQSPFTETVIGAERVAMIQQKTNNIFSTSDYISIIETIQQFVHAPDLSIKTIMTYEYVIADHLRALHRLVADGAPSPGKNGRQRIIKILIRRVLTRLIILGIHTDDFLPTVVSTIAKGVSAPNGSCPEWTEDRLIEYFSAESGRFSKTLERGQRNLEAILQKNDGQTLSGSQIVHLEKECGFPSILTRAILNNKGLAFKSTEYKKALSAIQTSARRNFQ